MANARAIVKRLKAVKNIKKITRTMELIATARFKKALDRATEAAAYTKKIGEIVADLAGVSGELSHPLLVQPATTDNARLLVLTSNRGLCGGYNAATLRAAIRRLREFREDGVPTALEVSGKRGLSFLEFQGEEVETSHTHFEDSPRFDDVDVIAERLIEDFTSGKVDRVDVAYMRFDSIARQTATVETLLPIGDLGGADDEAGEAGGSNEQYEFLPSAEDILLEIVPASFKARLFKCFLDAAVSEQIARMVAMKGATENASEMIGDLSQKYNRARQAAITSELAEVIGGAAALD
ncbi:MAG: ATP synthase F1 subunit gamma [Planctomycetota bacterium]